MQYNCDNYCFVIFVLSTVVTWASSEENELIFANLIWRHGARSPVRSYPTNPYNNKPVWPQGFGQLTQVGMRQEFALGRYFRERYKHLLSSQYNRSEIYIRSTDYDRTLMSAQSNMAGLFPPEGRQQWNGTSTNWQPIPIHTVPLSNDMLLRYPLIKCKTKFNQLTQKIRQSKEYKDVDKKYEDFFNKVATAIDWKGKLNMSNIWMIRDPIIAEQAEGLALPAWVTPDVLHTMNEVTGIEMSMMFGGPPAHYRVPMARISSGALVKQLIENFHSIMNGSSTYKVIAYSAHDTTLSSLLIGQAAFNMKPPPFASAVMFELYRSNSGYYFNAFYRNSTNETVPLDLLGCGINCSISKFVKLTQDIIVGDYTKECPSYTGSDNEIHISLVEFIAVGSCLLLSWFVFAVLFCRNRRRNSLLYESLPLNDGYMGKK